MTAFLDPTNIGRLIAVVLFLLIAVWCFQVAGKERVQKLCLIALGLVFMVPPVMGAAQLFGSQVWLFFSAGLGVLLGIAALILAIVGLATFQRQRAFYDRGRAQGIWAILIAVFLLGQFVYGVGKVVVPHLAAAREVREVNALFAADMEGDRYYLRDFNLSFASPGNLWLALEPKSINSAAELVLTQRRPEKFIIVIPEVLGAESDLGLAAYGQVVRANLVSGIPGARPEAAEPMVVSGIAGERFSAKATMGLNRLHCEFWYGIHNGLALQVMAYGASREENRVREAHRRFLEGLQLIDPNHLFVADGELIHDPLEFREEGFSVAFPEAVWITTLPGDFPEAAFRAMSLQGGRINVVRADLEGLDADADAITSALLAIQGLAMEEQTIISKRDRQEPDGTRVRDLVLALENNEGGRYHDYYRIHRRGDRLVMVNVWNDRKKSEKEAWDPQGALGSVRVHSPIPRLDYERLPPERREAQGRLINQIGLHYFMRAQHEASLGFFRLASRIVPEDFVIASNCIEALVQMEAYEEALAEAERHLQKFPDHTAVVADRAKILAALDRLEEAQVIYAGLFQAGYEDDDVLLDYVNLLIDLDREEEALMLIEREVEKRPSRHLRRWEGQVARLAGYYRQAEEAFRAIAETDGWDSQLFAEMVAVFQVEGDHHKALEWLDQQEEQMGATFDVWMGRGRSQLQLGLLLESHVSFTQALTVRPRDPDARAFLAEIAARQEEEGTGGVD
jgi:tetratricopeptide (TPR) repeat protein